MLIANVQNSSDYKPSHSAQIRLGLHVVMLLDENILLFTVQV